MLFQQGALLTDYDVFENVAFPLREHTDLPERLIRQVVLTKLHVVGFRGAARLLPSELSGGMKRRVLIAKALAHEPDLLFLDEPTAGVDVELRKGMWAIIDTMRARGVTIILTTHYIEEAEMMADRVGIINRGKLLMVDEKDAMMARLGRTEAHIILAEPLAALPPEIARFPVELEAGGTSLCYRGGDGTGKGKAEVAELTKALIGAGIDYTGIETRESSLEDIFVSLLGEGEVAA